jgi:hypothetical protein
MAAKSAVHGAAVHILDLNLREAPIAPGDLILNQVIQIATEEAPTKAEQKMQKDFIPGKRGVSL